MNRHLEIVDKPWGYEQLLPSPYINDEKPPKYRSKILVVYPKHSLSLQYHMFRDEYWTVLHGSGIVTLEKKEYRAYVGSEWWIPRERRHRLEASAKEPIVIKEYSTGDVWNTDDIIRIEDKYGRLK